MRKNNRKGFTIVELVIVIAVIAILAGVLIPTFSSVVEKANKSAEIQEVRNAYTQYLDTAKGEPADKVYVAITRDDNTTVYYLIEDGQLDVEQTPKPRKPGGISGTEITIVTVNDNAVVTEEITT